MAKKISRRRGSVQEAKEVAAKLSPRDKKTMGSIVGLANRVVPAGQTLAAAVELARQIASFPQTCMLADRLATYTQDGQDVATALDEEARTGLAVLRSGESVSGASKFAGGSGRHGSFSEFKG